MSTSVCSMVMGVPSGSISRSSALMQPEVMVNGSSPRALPMAATVSPISTSSESPTDTVCRPEASILSSATSFMLSPPTTSTGYSSPE